MQTTQSGFALLLVLWTLAMLSVIALALASTTGTELRASQDGWNDLQAERLAAAGHEVATYLGTRGLGTATEDLTGLPVERLGAGITYQVAFGPGTVDIVFEGENQKLDLTSAGEDAIIAFFNSWTGDSRRAAEIAASIADWIDADDDPRLLGAESASYQSGGYRPRNGSLGSADLFLIQGLTPQDFAPAIIESRNSPPAVRPPLSWFVSTFPTGRPNVNYASSSVLESVPGITPEIVRSILAERQRSTFTNAEDFRSRISGVDSTILDLLSFDRGSAPAVLTVARLKDSSRTHSERRTIRQVVRRRPLVLALVERDALGK